MRSLGECIQGFLHTRIVEVDAASGSSWHAAWRGPVACGWGTGVWGQGGGWYSRGGTVAWDWGNHAWSGGGCRPYTTVEQTEDLRLQVLRVGIGRIGGGLVGLVGLVGRGRGGLVRCC